MALVSVVIPCHAQAHFLADAIESVLAQTHAEREVIVVDDGSPDDVRAVTCRYPEVRHHHQGNRGLAGARNAGLALAQGSYLVFLDADDRLLPQALRAGTEAFARHPHCAFVWGFNLPIDAEGQRLPWMSYRFSGGASYRQLLEQNVVGPPLGVMFRRDILVTAGGFSPRARYAEDYELYLRLARQHPSFCHEQVIAEYRLHGANMSSDYRGMLQGMLAALRDQEPWVRHDPELRRALAAGRQDARLQYGAEPRIEQLRKEVRSGQWWRATRSGAGLLLRHPRQFLQTATRYLKKVALSRAL